MAAASNSNRIVPEVLMAMEACLGARVYNARAFTYCCERCWLAGAGFLGSKHVPRGHKSA
jgi:hypothetical protein